MLTLAALVLVAPGALFAAALDDHFDGNSGGVPAGWTEIAEGGVVEESGTQVSLQDGDVGILTDASFDVSAGATMIFDVLSIGNQLFMGVIDAPPPSLASGFILALTSDGTIVAAVFEGDAEPSDTTVVGTVSGYVGGSIQVTLTLTPADFSVSTVSPDFAAGPLAYPGAFTPAGLSGRAALFNDSPDDPPTTSSAIDRIQLDLAGPTGCVDNDGDGYGDPGDPSCDGGEETDCDDNDPDVFPGNPEVCDGKDNDCSGDADEGLSGGSAQCLDLTQVTCYNRSTRRRVTIFPAGPDWDCAASGLVVSPGHRLTQYIYGTAQSGCSPVGGAVCDVTPSYLQCLNLDNGTRAYPPVAGSWDCEAAGMVVTDGQRVRMTVDGTAE